MTTPDTTREDQRRFWVCARCEAEYDARNRQQATETHALFADHEPAWDQDDPTAGNWPDGDVLREDARRRVRALARLARLAHDTGDDEARDVANEEAGVLAEQYALADEGE